jgi:hypothetical protein
MMTRPQAEQAHETQARSVPVRPRAFALGLALMALQHLLDYRHRGALVHAGHHQPADFHHADFHAVCGRAAELAAAAVSRRERCSQARS